MEELQKCHGVCGELLPLSSFNKNKNYKNSHWTYCRECDKIRCTNPNPISGVYKVEAPDGKVYIGESYDIEKRRFLRYKSLNCKSQIYLYESLVKHGADSHTFEIIEECLQEIRRCRERYWQEFYDVLNPEKGLNGFLSKCGDKKVVRRSDMQEKMTFNRIGKGVGERSAMAEAVINTLTLKEYISATEAHKESNVESYDYFKSKLNGSSRNDTYFMYLKDYSVKGAIEPVYVKPSCDKVIDTFTLIEYPSTTQAAEAIGTTQSVLSRYLSGERVNNSFMVYKKDYVEGQMHYPQDGHKRRITDLNKNKIYLGVPDIVKEYGITVATVIKILKNGFKVEGIDIRYYEPELDWKLLIS